MNRPLELAATVARAPYQPRFGDDGIPHGLTAVLLEAVRMDDPDVQAAARALLHHYEIAIPETFDPVDAAE